MKTNNNQKQYLKLLKDFFSSLDHLTDLIYSNGGLSVFVGGCIRDIIIGTHNYDIDLEVYFCSHKKIQKIIKPYKYTEAGSSFGVFKLHHINVDLSIPRQEKCTGIYHTSFEIEYDIYTSFKKAASRRDFTINSIGYCYDYNILIDPYDGIQDIKNRVIRCTNPKKFLEDPLRLLRAIYFSSKLNFKIDSNLHQMIIKNSHLLENITYERICNENIKVLMTNNIEKVLPYFQDFEQQIFILFKVIYKHENKNLIINQVKKSFNIVNKVITLSKFISLKTITASVIFGMNFNKLLMKQIYHIQQIILKSDSEIFEHVSKERDFGHTSFIQDIIGMFQNYMHDGGIVESYDYKIKILQKVYLHRKYGCQAGIGMLVCHNGHKKAISGISYPEIREWQLVLEKYLLSTADVPEFNDIQNMFFIHLKSI